MNSTQLTVHLVELAAIFAWCLLANRSSLAILPVALGAVSSGCGDWPGGGATAGSVASAGKEKDAPAPLYVHPTTRLRSSHYVLPS